MNKGVVVAASVGAVVVVGLGLAASGGIPKRGWGWQSKGKAEIQVTLSPTASGCAVNKFSDVLGAKKNGKVRWKVTNTCSTSQYIRFQNFQRWHLTDDDKDPADSTVIDPPQPGNSIPAGGSVDIDADLKKGPLHSPWFDTYAYDVYFGPDATSLTRMVDPDVEIWP